MSAARGTGLFEPAGTVRLSAKGTARWRAGHPWIFRDDVGAGRMANGDVVTVLSPPGDSLGTAFYGSESKIALRRIARAGTSVDEALFTQRMRDAIAGREELAPGVSALRLISSDADGVPGLVVDRYGDHLSLQSLIAGVDRRLPFFVEQLVDRLQPASIVARNDVGVRRLEGLAVETHVLHGEVPAQVEIRMGGIALQVDLLHGQKTGTFLDQRENQAAAAGYLRGDVLDAFCYDGGFALQAARGARSVEAVDSSEGALERAARNAQRNELTNIRFIRANVFDHLSELDRSSRRFDGVVLDPPAFAKSRKDLPSAARAYKEINLRAMRILSPGGVLVTCTCSYNLLEGEFVEILSAAAADARRSVTIMEKRSQARDHPVLLGLPESHYLKCLILKVG